MAEAQNCCPSDKAGSMAVTGSAVFLIPQYRLIHGYHSLLRPLLPTLSSQWSLPPLLVDFLSCL